MILREEAARRRAAAEGHISVCTEPLFTSHRSGLLGFALAAKGTLRRTTSGPCDQLERYNIEFVTVWHTRCLFDHYRGRFGYFQYFACGICRD